MVQNISAAGARLDNIVKDMVDVSMIDQKQMSLKLGQVDINALVEAAVKELRYFLVLRKQEIAMHLAASLPMIRGDQTRLTQLFSNILGNDIKFTPDGGTVSVRTALKQVDKNRLLPGFGNSGLNIGRNQQQFIEIVISDTGIGIDKDDQRRIFDKFYEAGNIEEHSSGKVAFKARGAGLGLSISKGVTDMHGGQLWVESPGYDPHTCPGSSFIILLPIEQSQE